MYAVWAQTRSDGFRFTCLRCSFTGGAGVFIDHTGSRSLHRFAGCAFDGVDGGRSASPVYLRHNVGTM